MESSRLDSAATIAPITAIDYSATIPNGVASVIDLDSLDKTLATDSSADMPNGVMGVVDLDSLATTMATNSPTNIANDVTSLAKESPILPNCRSTDADLEALSVLTKNTFFPTADYVSLSKKDLKDALYNFAHQHHFQLSQEGKIFRCLKADAPPSYLKKKEKRRALAPEASADGQIETRQRANYHCGCQFRINIGIFKDCRVRILPSSVYWHSDECNPNAAEAPFHERRQGLVTARLKEQALQTLIDLTIQSRNIIPASTIGAILRPFWPDALEISAQDCCNIRLKVQQIINQACRENCDPRSPQYLSSNLKLFEESKLGESAEFIDEASQYARQILEEVLNSSDLHNSSRRIEKYLADLKRRDPGFDFCVLAGEDGVWHGYIWMTTAMRGNWELYGDVLFLDMMRRQLNKVHWPYVSVALLDGDKHVCLASEGNVVSETLSAYRWAVEMTCEMGPM